MLGLQGNRVWGEMWQNVVCEWGRRSLSGEGHSRTGSRGRLQSNSFCIFLAASRAASTGDRTGIGFPLRHWRMEETREMQSWRDLRNHTRSHWDDSVRCGEKVDWGVYKGPSEAWLVLWSETPLAWTMGKERHRRVKTVNTPEIVRRWLSSQRNKTDIFLVSLL